MGHQQHHRKDAVDQQGPGPSRHAIAPAASGEPGMLGPRPTVPTLGPRWLLGLQRLVGNEATSALVVQRLLKFNDPPSVALGRIQQQLNVAGANPRLEVTGRFDKETENAVKAFQATHPPMSVTGQLDDATRKKLDSVAKPGSPSGVSTMVIAGEDVRGVTPSKVGGDHLNFDLTSKGVAVRELQERLNASPTMSAARRRARAIVNELLPIDGVGGSGTEPALKQLRNDSGVPAAGQADVATWKKPLVAGPARRGRVEHEWPDGPDSPGPDDALALRRVQSGPLADVATALEGVWRHYVPISPAPPPGRTWLLASPTTDCMNWTPRPSAPSRCWRSTPGCPERGTCC